MSIRLTITLTDANTTINIPRDPVNGEWQTLKVLKVFHNVNAGTVATTKAMFLLVVSYPYKTNDSSTKTYL